MYTSRCAVFGIAEYCGIQEDVRCAKDELNGTAKHKDTIRFSPTKVIPRAMPFIYGAAEDV